MKKILKYSLLAVLALSALAGCKKALETDQFAGFSLAAIAPNPVMRGAELRIIGNGLENVSEVQFAGGVSVTEIEVVTKGERSEIRVTVPVEGPEIGPVTVLTKEGLKASTRFDLEFTEPIEQASFSPATALSGDVITIQGEYLQNVKCVIFGGDAKVNEFVSQSRHELKVAVPCNALTGPVILSDVDEVNDATTIPNQIYSEKELVIGQPTVVSASKATYKSGDVITVSGEHLDMIANVALNQVSEVEFSVAEDKKSISFNLPPKASDGHITLTSYAGDEFDAGEIETVSVSDLSIKSLAEDNRYKAGCEVEISGEDLDLVTKVEFNGAEASWYYSDGKIIATQPGKAKDGVVTVTLDNGKQVMTEEIEVVKPVASGVDSAEGVAGSGTITVSGSDLDLVTSVKIGTKVNTFIDCEFVYNEVDDNLVVTLSPNAYTGILTLTSENGSETYTDEITVTYDNVIDFVFEKNPIELGSKVALSGKNLSSIESIVIKNVKVLNYTERSEGRVEFVFPEDLGPGVYRLDITLMDGTQLKWPVPLTVTASYEKRILWSGNTDITWGDGGRVIIPAEDFEDIPAGTLMYICYTQKDGVWAQAQFNYGDWSGINFNEGEIQFNQTLVPTNVYGWFSDGILDRVTPVVLTTEILENIQAKKGDCEDKTDCGIIIQGSDLIFTEIYVNLPVAGEQVIWEGETDITWADGGRVIIPAEAFAKAKPGKIMALYYTQKDGVWAQAQFNYGDWSGINFNGEEGVQFEQTLVPTNVYGWFSDGILDRCTEVELTAEILENIQAKKGDCEDQTDCGIIIQGSDLIFTKITLK